MFLKTDLTKQAYLIACDAHFWQCDRMGELYILHPMAVAEHFDTEELVAAALLHDVLEDNAEWTVARLYGHGMPPEVVRLVCILTRQKGESYFDYIRRASQDKAATQIKLADLKHNTDVRRLDGLSDSLRARYNNMNFYQDMMVYIEGDAAAITTSDYTCRMATPARVVDEPNPEDDYVLLSVAEIDGDHNVWLYALKTAVRPLEEYS